MTLREEHQMSSRVLIVDNDPCVSALYVEILAREGLDARSVTPPERAAVLVDQQTVDLLVVDVDLPDKKGPKVAWAIREKGHEMPIIGLVATDGAWDPDDLKDLGFSLLLNKPVEGPQLLLSVRNLVQTARPQEAAGGASQSA